VIREHLFDKRAPADPLFRWRGGDVSRVEGLSDAVFAFALTLLVVSLEVPRSFDELMSVIRSFPAFAACFALLVMVWYYHYQFFRRFGVEDVYTIVLNTILLFVVLFYVYPLKYVFNGLIGPLVGSDTPWFVQGRGQGRTLMLFFSAGFTTIFVLLALMTLHAWRLREALELDALERLLTRGALRAHLLSASLGVASLGLALVGERFVPWSGLIYFLMGPVQFANGYVTGRKADALHRAMIAGDG